MPRYKLRREGEYWYIVGSNGGRSFHHSTREKDEALANIIFDNWLREKLTPNEAKPDQIAVSVVLSRYEDDRRGEFAKPSTFNWARDTLLAFYKADTVASISAATNKDFEVYCLEHGLAKSSVNRIRSVLRAALKHAVKDGKLVYAPFIPRVKLPKGKELWLTRPGDDQGNAMAVLKLYRAIRRKRHRYLNLFVRIALGTGARHSAILGLTWDRVDFKTGVIDFRDPDIAETKKRRPHAPVGDRLLRLLRAAKRVSNSEYVICHPVKGRVASIRVAFLEAVARAGLSPKVTPHILKHTCITWLLRDGVDIWDVAALTNTTVTTIEAVYGHHVRDNRLRDVVNRRSARMVLEQAL